MTEEPRPVTMPGLHERVWPFIVDALGPPGTRRVLDIGAGEGALTKRLHERGFETCACDLSPEAFRYGEVECRRADLSEALPYDSDTFDAAVAVEVTEHLLDPGRFFAECARVLKPGGVLVTTTPNVLSLKSRLRFLVSGFPGGYIPLGPAGGGGLQHVMPLGLDQYRHAAAARGLEVVEISVDRYQRSSLVLLPLWFLAWPLMWLFGPRLHGHNNIALLLGRVLVTTFTKT